ncbi:50S ribosomal protein L18 [Candidatus Azambacteria bacterium]|nr:50S ribosomal protein L18 [Candidatus Azambacteria bacterium]
MSDRIQRHKRIRAKLSGTASKPRLSVFRSSHHIYAQLIDDEKGKTLVASSDVKMKKDKNTKSDLAKMVGVDIAKKAKEKKIEEVVFDRGGHKFHGRVRSLAEGAREGGLKF